MPRNVDPAEMTPHERLSELAGILAKGFLTSRPQPRVKNTTESAGNSLDSGCETSPHANTG